MKLGTIKDGTRDGQLVVISQDNKTFVSAKAIAKNLQTALDSWSETESQLKELSAKLNRGEVNGEHVVTENFLAPLPRSYEWIDGSAYINHIVLVRKARNAALPATLKTSPLVYQGGSGCFLAPTQDILLGDMSWGLDFESEICVIVDDVPQGTKKEDAHKYIRLIMICNDVSLRGLIPEELEKGFGFFVSKPSTAFSPFCVTPDELGSHWQDGRLHLPLKTWLNNELVGQPNAGPEMYFSFYDLMEHITKTRPLTAGTIIGSGTVSNEDRSKGISCLAEQRMIEKIETGEFKTPFMKPNDVVEIEMFDEKGHSLFGRIHQKVKAI